MSKISLYGSKKEQRNLNLVSIVLNSVKGLTLPRNKINSIHFPRIPKNLLLSHRHIARTYFFFPFSWQLSHLYRIALRIQGRNSQQRIVVPVQRFAECLRSEICVRWDPPGPLPDVRH